MAGDEWERLRDPFVDQYATLFGQVRTHVIHQHLRTHLPPPPATVVDIGGGAGHQSIPLAREGYRVTLVDPSPAMLAAAAARLEAEGPAVAARVRLVDASGETALEVLGDARFAGVLCHGVLMYLDDPHPLVTVLGTLAGAHGIVSIVTKNAKSLAMRPAYDRDWDATLAAFDADRQVNGLGVDTRADTVEHLTTLLDEQGFDTVAWYGVRLLSESWARSEPRADPAAKVLAAELEASRRDPYRQLSRLFHLVAARR